MRRAALLAVLAVVAAGCGGSDDGDETGASSEAPIRTITVNETDFKLDPSSISLDEPGTYAFEVVNKGQVAHALEIEGQGAEEKTDTLDPGTRATLKAKLEAGTYELYCPVDNHADQGMKGELEVAGESDSSGDGY
jgi:uncharacterized cupredoxin-like copper-binding protein